MLPPHDNSGSHDIKGGLSIEGRISAYKERFHASDREIMKMPYVQFLIRSADCPQIDYDSKKKKNKTHTADSVDSQISAIAACLG